MNSLNKAKQKKNLSKKVAAVLFLATVFFIFVGFIFLKKVGAVDFLAHSFYEYMEQGKEKNELLTVGKVAGVSTPNWAYYQQSLKMKSAEFVRELEKFQDSNGTIFDMSMGQADDEVEYFWHVPAIYYLSGDQEVYDVYKNEVKYYWDQKIEGDKYNGYTKDASYDTEHTLEALMGLGNLSYMKQSDPWVSTRLEDLVDNLGNWDSGSVDWFNESTGHLKTYAFGTEDIKADCPEGFDTPWNLRFVPMAIASYLENSNSRYLNWAGDYLDGWLETAQKMEDEEGYYIIPSSVDPDTGNPGKCGEWYDGVAGDWIDGGFYTTRPLRQAILGYFSVTKDSKYLEAAKKMIEALFDEGDGSDPAHTFDGSSWQIETSSGYLDHFARMFVQLAIQDEKVDADFDQMLNEWLSIRSLDLSIVDLWEMRTGTEESNQAMITTYLSNASSEIENKLNIIRSISDSDELKKYLDDNCYMSDKKSYGDRMMSCFSLENESEAIFLSAFAGFRPNETDLPWMEVVYYQDSGEVGLPDSLSAIVLQSSDEKKIVKLYNNGTTREDIKIQAGYISKDIRSARIIEKNSEVQDVSLTVNDNKVELYVELTDEVIIEINLSETVPEVGVCGNGLEEGGEDCDDGNLINGDGCSSACEKEINVSDFLGCNVDNTLCKMGEGRNPNIAMDRNGVIHMIYQCRCSGSTEAVPKYDAAECSSLCYRTWDCEEGISDEEIVSSKNSVYSRIDFDNSNKPHVVWQGEGGVGYNKKTGNSWEFGQAGRQIIQDGVLIDKPRLAIDGNDEIFISFTDELPGESGWRLSFVHFGARDSAPSFDSNDGIDVYNVAHAGLKLSNGDIAIDINNDVHFQWSNYDDPVYDDSMMYARYDQGSGTIVDVKQTKPGGVSNFSDIDTSLTDGKVYGVGETGWALDGLVYLWGDGSIQNSKNILDIPEVGPQIIDGDYLQTDITVDVRGIPYITWTGYDRSESMTGPFCDNGTKPGDCYHKDTKERSDPFTVCNSDQECRDSLDDNYVCFGGSGPVDSCDDCMVPGISKSCDASGMPWHPGYYTMINPSTNNASTPNLIAENGESISTGETITSHSRQGTKKYGNPHGTAAGNQGIIVAFEYAVPPSEYSIWFKMLDGANICYKSPRLKTDFNCDGRAGVKDLGIMLSRWMNNDLNVIEEYLHSSCSDPKTLNLNKSGSSENRIDIFDVNEMLYCWGTPEASTCFK
jgi:cysteine-rich repeat protein